MERGGNTGRVAQAGAANRRRASQQGIGLPPWLKTPPPFQAHAMHMPHANKVGPRTWSASSSCSCPTVDHTSRAQITAPDANTVTSVATHTCGVEGRGRTDARFGAIWSKHEGAGPGTAPRGPCAATTTRGAHSLPHAQRCGGASNNIQLQHSGRHLPGEDAEEGPNVGRGLPRQHRDCLAVAAQGARAGATRGSGAWAA